MPVLALTMVWGAAWGIAFGVAIDALSVTTPRLGGTGLGGSRLGEMLGLGVVVPILATAVMIAGPLVLLRDRRFNDVVDGATFGVASAVAFVGAQVIARLDRAVRRRPHAARGAVALDRPDRLDSRSRSRSWQPVPSARRSGPSGCRYRAPVRDRAALGSPAVRRWPCTLAAALLVATALAPICLGRSSPSSSSWRSRPWRCYGCGACCISAFSRRPTRSRRAVRSCAPTVATDPAPHVLRELRDLAPCPAQAP